VCGFVGRILHGFSVPNTRPIDCALPYLRRRGPDSWNTWRSLDDRVELLHTRLAIVDIDDRAQQPFTNVEHRSTIVFNGEIYNHRELRAELQCYPFVTTSDTEVLLALVLLHGVNALSRLRGMFSAALIQESSRRVFIFRDPIGKKPVFVARWPDSVCFGSSVLALRALTTYQPTYDQSALDNYWELGHVSPDQSIYPECIPLLPGEVLELDWDGRVIARSSCSPATRTYSLRSAVQVREYTHELLANAVQRRLHNNPRPVCLLSGGIDSTVVATHMKRIVPSSAITLGALIPGTLDEKYARFAAHKLQVPLQVVRVRISPRGTADNVRWALDLQDEPLGMMAFFPLALMVRAVKDYGRILFTGDGGDEVFLGYGQPNDWLHAGSGHPDQASARCFAFSSWSPPAWMSTWGRQMVGQSLLGHMFTKLDRATAEQGVEARCPLLDWDLVSFIKSLEPQQIFLGQKPKGLLKNELQAWPGWFVDRPKLGFTYRLRWAWALTAFSGLRETVTTDTMALFKSRLPLDLRRPPNSWTTFHIFQHFPAVWKLLAFARFQDREQHACQTT
jgi:asparagine synthase (glutamine-hydrolysing)